MKNLFLFILLLYLVGCSAMQESEQDTTSEKQSVYVFDDISTPDTVSTAVEEVTEATLIKEDSTETQTTFQFFIVQVGAFSTQKKAETFVNATKDKTDYDLNIHYSEEKELFVVQLPPFRTREKAEEVRNELWNISDFSGAFIVVPNK